MKIFGVDVEAEELKAMVTKIAEQWEQMDEYDREWYDDYSEFEEMQLHDILFPEV